MDAALHACRRPLKNLRIRQLSTHGLKLRQPRLLPFVHSPGRPSISALRAADPNHLNPQPSNSSPAGQDDAAKPSAPDSTQVIPGNDLALADKLAASLATPAAKSSSIDNALPTGSQTLEQQPAATQTAHVDTPAPGKTADQPASKAFAAAFAPGTVFMFLSVLPPALFILHRVVVVLLQLIVFIICNLIFADHSVPPLTWRNFCQACLETSSLLDELVPVLLLALAGLQQAFMDACSGLFRLLLLAPALIPAASAVVAAINSPTFTQTLADMGQRLPEKVRSTWVAFVGKLHGAWAPVAAKIPPSWGEKIVGVWSALQTPAAQQLLLQSSILVMTGWLASVFTEPLRPGSRLGTPSLILFILLRIATFVVDVAVLRQLWGGLKTIVQGGGTLSHSVDASPAVARLALARAVLELTWAFSIGLRCMYGITTGWKVMVAIYLMYYASSTWQLTREQAESWPQSSWVILCLHVLVAMTVSWPLCLPSWEALPELGIIHRGSHGFWGSL